MKDEKKLGLGLLVALGIGSMIGGGIFNSPTDLIGKANPQAALLAWAVGGIGVIFLALVFQLLASKRPELKGGIYTYAREGFGEYVGFNSAWGYWLSAWLGNIAFFTLIFKTLDSLLGKGNELGHVGSFIAASILLWVLHFIISKGIEQANVLNAIVTIAKIIPLVLVIVFGIAVFSSGTFNVSNWQTILASADKGQGATTVFSQVKGAMSTILWCFIGVEASVVLSERAKSQKVVGSATVISLLITLLLYVAISFIAMGAIPAKALAGSSAPLADVLAKTVLGSAGAVIVKVGLIVSLLGALLGWLMLSAETPYIGGNAGVFPSWFAKQNKAGVAINSLVVTDVVTQLFLGCMLLSQLQSVYSVFYTISTTAILVPYLLSSLYALKVCVQDKLSIKDYLLAIIASVYSAYVIYAVGIAQLGEVFILYAVGIIIYILARKEKGKKITTAEVVTMIVILCIAALVIFKIATGAISVI